MDNNYINIGNLLPSNYKQVIVISNNQVIRYLVNVNPSKGYLYHNYYGNEVQTSQTIKKV